MPLSPPPSLPERLQKVLEDAQALAQWIAGRQDGLEISGDDKAMVPGLLFDLAIEHHAGIVHLVQGQMNGSAFALLRAVFETFVRGAWLQLCATGEELENFIKRDELPRFAPLVEAIDQHADFADKLLSKIKNNSWNAMCSYTHGGVFQLARRFDGSYVVPTYDPEEVIEVIKYSGTFALFALLKIARLADNGSLVQEINMKLQGSERENHSVMI